MLFSQLYRKRITIFLSAFSYLMVLNGLLVIIHYSNPIISFIFKEKVTSVDNFIHLYKLGFNFQDFISCFLGYLLIILARGLYKRYAFIWFSTLFIYFYFSLHLNYSLLKSYFIAQILLGFLGYKIFWRKVSTFSISYYPLVIILSFLLALMYGTIGSYVLKEQFIGLKTWTDAVYFTLVTYSTLGYGDIVPHTEAAKYFVISMIIIGLSNFATAGSFILYSLTNRVQLIINKFEGKKIRMKNHIILCGYSAISKVLIAKFLRDDTPFILLDNQINNELQEIKQHCVNNSNPSGIAALKQANLVEAKMIIAAFDNDAENILTIFNARELTHQHGLKSIKLVAKIALEENIIVAQKNGAQEIVSPTLMAANAIISFI